MVNAAFTGSRSHGLQGMTETMTVDVIVAGGGGAGMFAALYAADLGLRVLLLEKDSTAPSNTAIASGMIPAAGSRFQTAAGLADTPDTLFEDVQRANGGRADAAVLAALCRRSADVVHYLADAVGVPLHLQRQVLHPGHRHYRMHATPGESGAELIDAMRAALARRPALRYRDGVALQCLVVKNGAVVGVEAKVAGEALRFDAPGVILACGGFGGNAAMLGRHCPEIAGGRHVGAASNDGTAINAGVEIGASLAHMSAYQGHSHANPDHGTHLSGALPSLGAILINFHGHRFAAEDQGSSPLAKHILAQPGERALQLFDHRIHDIAMRFGPFRQADAAGAIVRAADTAALADRFAIPAAAIEAELEAYNEACATESDRFGRTQFGAALRPPFYGSIVTGALAHTQGGLRIDASARVLGAGGAAIPGLFAAGGSAASISGDGAEGYLSGNGLLQTFGTALLAAEAADRGRAVT